MRRFILLRKRYIKQSLKALDADISIRLIHIVYTSVWPLPRRIRKIDYVIGPRFFEEGLLTCNLANALSSHPIYKRNSTRILEIIQHTPEHPASKCVDHIIDVRFCYERIL